VSILDGSTDDLAESSSDEPSLWLVVGGYLLSVAVLGSMALGVLAFFSPDEHRVRSLVGLAISLPVAFLLMRRAVKFMAWILFGGMVRALYFHLGAAWPFRMFMIIYCFAGGILCLTFMDRKLSLFDRLALLAFVFSFCVGVAYDGAGPKQGRPATDMVAAVIASAGLGILALAWAYDRSRGRATSASDAMDSLDKQTPRLRW
jgi:hypothetical protein